MDRKEFLSLLGISAAALTCSYLFGGCSSKSNPVAAPPANVDFTLDLSDSANSALKSNGGYLYKDGIIVARTINGDYVAVSQTCTHQGGTVYYDKTGNEFHCPNHGSNFATSGSVINGPATTPLMKYNTSLSNTSLRVYS
ncbi:MAG: Rieske (2Fe-2S) protein [Bacteroidota bacterium]|nr:Rieske (2Fe-2S) protein [Bacteroidota bacterium]